MLLYSDVGCILFDEFHERNLDGDTCLALALDITRRGRRGGRGARKGRGRGEGQHGKIEEDGDDDGNDGGEDDDPLKLVVM